MLDGKSLPGLADLRARGRTSTRGFQAKNAAGRRGNADRAASVPTGCDRHDARRHCCRRPAGRATGGALRIPGIACWTKGLVFGVWRQTELGGVGLADHDYAAPYPAARQFTVHVGGNVLKQLIAHAGRDALQRRHQIFHQERYACEGAIGQDRFGRFPRPVVELVDNGIQLRVVGFDTLNGLLHQFCWCHFLLTNQLR